MPSAPRTGRTFKGLLSDPPAPLVDDEAVQPLPAPAPAPVATVSATPSADPEKPVEPAPRSQGQPTAEIKNAPTTVRLRQSVANALETAWLEERRTGDPRVSATEFASRAVMAGLAVLDKAGRSTAAR
jgi:hypothetical protein